MKNPYEPVEPEPKKIKLHYSITALRAMRAQASKHY